MSVQTTTWDNRLLMLSPKGQRQFWIDEIKRRSPHGMAVNCRYMPSLGRTPILRKLIEDGFVTRVREWRGNHCNRTILHISE